MSGENDLIPFAAEESSTVDNLKSDKSHKLNDAVVSALKIYASCAEVYSKAYDNNQKALTAVVALQNKIDKQAGSSSGDEARDAAAEHSKKLAELNSIAAQAKAAADEAAISEHRAYSEAVRSMDEKRVFIETIRDYAQRELIQLEHSCDSSTLKKQKTELSLSEAALNDLIEQMRDLAKKRQDKNKQRAAKSARAGAKEEIAKDELAGEIAAVLAEADRIKTNGAGADKPNPARDIKSIKTEEPKVSKNEVKAPAQAKPDKKAVPAKEQKPEAKKGVKEAVKETVNPDRYRLKKYYNEVVVKQLEKQFNLQNVNEVPKLVKITLNMGLGDVKDDAKKLAQAVEELKLICGQKPVVTKAKKSVANFKLREGMNVGAMVTLRGKRMYEFLDKLISIALPRVRDFKGANPNSFDGRGNYAMGIKEQLIFPEIRYDQIDKIRGFDICIVTTAKSDELAKGLLACLGMPFKA